MLSVFAFQTFIIIISKKRESIQIVGRSLSLILVITGNAMGTTRKDIIYKSIGIIYDAGTTLLILVTRIYHICGSR